VKQRSVEMKILLAIDSSASSEAALIEVASRPWPTPSTFCVLHVPDLYTPIEGQTGKTQLMDAQYRGAQSLVMSAADKLASCGLEVVTRVTEGYPPAAIVEYAKEWGADLIVVGSHGLSRVMRFLLGSVAKAVVRHAPCSVELVRPHPGGLRPAREGMKILLATDGSNCSVAAARSIAGRPWPAGSEVRVVSVVHIAGYLLSSLQEVPEEMALIESEFLAQGEEDVAAAERIIAGCGLKATSSVLKGYPKSKIVDEAEDWDADLVVVGSHGRRGLPRLLMGSVSEAVAMHAHCSVEVVR
jgi:nucleotide-binding universal stress UspA family protein